MDHRLKSTKDIEQLFKTGQTAFAFPVKLVWLTHPATSGLSHRYGVSVSKRNFKKAVDRNRIKRLLRASCRTVMSQHAVSPDRYTDMMFIYVSDKMLDFKIIDTAIRRLIKKFSK